MPAGAKAQETKNVGSGKAFSSKSKTKGKTSSALSPKELYKRRWLADKRFITGKCGVAFSWTQQFWDASLAYVAGHFLLFQSGGELKMWHEKNAGGPEKATELNARTSCFVAHGNTVYYTQGHVVSSYNVMTKEVIFDPCVLCLRSASACLLLLVIGQEDKRHPTFSGLRYAHRRINAADTSSAGRNTLRRFGLRLSRAAENDSAA